MLVICWVKTHTEIPSCLALKPRLTSCPVRPLTSFDAAQSSSMNRAREEEAGHPQPVLDLVLQAHDHKDVWIAVHEALVCLVLNKSGAEEHDVVKLALEGASQLVQKILCLTGIGWPHNQGVEGQFSWVHLYLCVGGRLVLNRFQLLTHDVHLRV